MLIIRDVQTEEDFNFMENWAVTKNWGDWIKTADKFSVGQCRLWGALSVSLLKTVSKKPHLLLVKA